MHVLTGHKGKGQEFDWVVVIGLETGHIPDFRTATAAETAEELRILHVMVSRARYGLILTFCRRDGWRTATASPWLEVLRATATRIDHA
jgi:DNA helicase-2/ATP-dependent DNA helicase PcrA